MFESLDFLYVPTDDVDAAARRYVEQLGAELVWKVRGMGTVVVCLRVSQAGPAILLSGHLDGATPILVYRVSDYADAIDRLRSAGVNDIRELELPQGPCASFGLPDGQRAAIYELTRPFVLESFAGRLDD
jgi:Glyoxalase/Bleomycin resistance protein/Dioxygenase superfamily